MNKNALRWTLIGIFAAVLFGTVAWFGLRRAQPGVQASLVGLPLESRDDFLRANQAIPLAFPHDHGPHPDYQTEWWYYTGNLHTSDGRQFGYQLTFFRRALLPAQERVPRQSEWAVEQVYLAHFTLTDVADQRFHAFERLSRGAAGLAGANGDPLYSVWLRDWSVEQTGTDTYQLHAEDGGLRLDLTLNDLKGVVLQGEQGYSRKGPEPGNASIYYSQTRLQSEGSVQVGAQTFQVSGFSWLDREFSTSVLSQGQMGWDWFSMQLDDGSELMVYQLRRADGSLDRFSKGLWVAPDGTTRLLEPQDFVITPNATWRSPHSSGVYPGAWKIQVLPVGLTLNVVPLMKDQELNLSFTYWEGAVQLSGDRNGKPVAGFGYVELTGYATSFEDQF